MRVLYVPFPKTRAPVLMQTDLDHTQRFDGITLVASQTVLSLSLENYLT